MSDNNIVKITECLLQNESDKFIRTVGIKSTLFSDYGVGQKPSLENFRDIVRLSEILTYNECLFDVEFDKIKEKLHKLTYDLR